MKKSLMLLLSILLGLSTFTACNPASESSVLTPAPSTAQVADEIKELPTPIAPGKIIVYDGLELVMIEAEITDNYVNEYGSNRNAPAGKTILWVHFTLKNVGQKEQSLPAPEHYSALHGLIEYKSIYGRRLDHTDYMTLTTTLVQGQTVDAWLRLDIPAALELQDLQFAYLPKSLQVSTGFSTTEYSWGDHPIFLWTCMP